MDSIYDKMHLEVIVMVYDQCLVLGRGVIVVEDQGAIVYIGSPTEDFQVMLKDLNLKEEELEKRDLSWFQALLDSYQEGSLDIFDTPIKLISGSEFQRSVWQELYKVSYGDIITYSDLANRLDKPKAVRAVASAIGKNPIMLLVPCHRVNGKDGSLRGFRGGLDLKVDLQEVESR